MSCTYSLDQLYAVLEKDAAEKVKYSRAHGRECPNGLLSVGLKLHCLDGGPQFDSILTALGGRERVTEMKLYRMDKSDAMCFILPPLGNVQSAISLLYALEESTTSKIFGNPKVQIQVCTPGRLDLHRAALLSIAFLLGSDVVRKEVKSVQLSTTFSDNSVGRRITIYDGGGHLERNFKWHSFENGKFCVEPDLPFRSNRTDVMLAQSAHDITIINLVATLLVHAQYPEFSGLWSAHGTSFAAALEKILNEHGLDELYLIPWVRTHEDGTVSDRPFNHAIKLLLNAANADARNLRRRNITAFEFFSGTSTRKSLLLEIKSLLNDYRETIMHEIATHERSGNQ